MLGKDVGRGGRCGSDGGPHDRVLTVVLEVSHCLAVRRVVNTFSVRRVAEALPLPAR